MEINPITLKIDYKKTTDVSEKIAESKQWEIEWKKWPRPETILWWHNWLIHKMEPNRLIFFDDKENTIAIKIWKWDYLQFNYEKIWDNKLREEKLANMVLSDTSLERAEIEAKDHYSLGKKYKFTFDFFIPEDFPIVDNRLVIWQWKQQFEKWIKNRPIIAQRFRNWKYTILLNVHWNPKIKWGDITVCMLDAKDILWKWIAAEYEIRFSENDDGYVKIRHNWVFLYEYRGKTSSSDKEYQIWKYYKDDFFFKFWLYKDTYKKRILELKNEKTTEENKEKIETLTKAIEDENSWKLMTIFFKNYKVEEMT